MSTKRSPKGNVLLLGMVFSDYDKVNRGQEYRDKVRCEAMEKLGYNVRTLDDKHDDTGIDKHCRCNFADTRRMERAMDDKWGKDCEYKFNDIVLDYFFSPVI